MNDKLTFRVMAFLSVGLGISGFIQVLPGWDVLWQPQNIGGLGMIIFATLIGLITKRPQDLSPKNIADFMEGEVDNSQPKKLKKDPPLAMVIAAIVLSCFWLMGCPSMYRPANPALTHAQQMVDSYYVKVHEAEAVYEQALIYAGELHGGGIITQEQLDKIELLGMKVKVHLDLAKTALRVYIATSTPEARNDWELQRDLFTAALDDLTAVGESYGIHLKI